MFSLHTEQCWNLSENASKLMVNTIKSLVKFVLLPGSDLVLERGDLEGQTVWKRIRRAIVELQAPPTGPAH
jgi:hypothetical protein